MKVRNANTFRLLGALGWIITVVVATGLNDTPDTDIADTTVAPETTAVVQKQAQPLQFLDGLSDADYDHIVALIENRRGHQAIDFITSRTGFSPANREHANRMAYEVSDLEGAEYFVGHLVGLDPTITANFSPKTPSPTELGVVFRETWEGCVQPMITGLLSMEPRRDYPEGDDPAATAQYGTKQIRTSDLILAMAHYARLQAQAGQKVLKQSGFNLQDQGDWERLLYKAAESGLPGVEHFAADGAARFPNSGALVRSHRALSGLSNRFAERCHRMVGQVFVANNR